MTIRVPELIVEVKNEYSAKSEPIVQAMNYYYRFSYLAIKTNQQNRVYPSFLIVLFGRTMRNNLIWCSEHPPIIKRKSK